MKTNFFNLLRKLAGKAPEPQPTQYAHPASKPAAPTAPKRNVVSAYVSAPHNSTVPRTNGNGHATKGVEIPLQKVLSGLSLELQPRLVARDTASLTISIPLEKVLSQLSRGQVRITFGELRQLAPSVFTADTDRDATWVSLPLEEILARLNPALITRRRVQRQVEVPEEISSPFEPDPLAGATANDFIGSSRMAPVAPVQPAPLNRHSAPAIQRIQPPEAFPAAPLRPEPTPLPGPFQKTNGNGNGHTIVPQPATPFRMPVAPIAPPPPFPGTPPMPPVAQAHAISPIDPIPMPSAAPLVPMAPAPAPVEPPRIPMPAAPRSAVAPLTVPLAALAASWPEPVRSEILHSGLTEAQVNLPFEAIDQGLRQGRILLPWKMLRMWLRPAPQVRISPEDATVLELPLAIIAPLFLARRGEINAQRPKVAVDGDIPNLFFGFPQPEPETKPSTTQDTNFYVWEDTLDQVKTEQQPAGSSSPGTRFVAKYATPNEVVSRAAALEGVAGALIALPDGLMVANRLPSDINGDTLSAFLPQIFSKVSQCTRELRMGELNNLNFTVGNVPWKIFRVNAIFFAAFGRAGAPLPTAQLAALAAELDHKPK